MNLSIESESPSADQSSIGDLTRNILVGLVLASIDAIILLGNALVIAAIAYTHRLQNVTNLYVGSLAAADLMVAIVVLPFAIAFELKGSWPLTTGWCKLWLSMDILLCTASILNLCCISLDRYMAITRPLAYATRRSSHLAAGMILCVWGVSGIITFPPILGWTDHRWREGNCTVSLHKGYRIYSSLGSFFIPFFIMLFVYCTIFFVAKQRTRVLRINQVGRQKSLHKLVVATTKTIGRFSDPSLQKRKRRLAAETQDHPDSPLDAVPSDEAPDEDAFSDDDDDDDEEEGEDAADQQLRICRRPRKTSKLQAMLFKSGNPTNLTSMSKSWLRNERPQQRSNPEDRQKEEKRRERAAFRREHKTAKTLAIVVGSFSACWLPFFIMYVVEPFCQCRYPETLVSVVVWLGYANSIFNPFIYAFYNKEYAMAFRRILGLKRRARR